MLENTWRLVLSLNWPLLSISQCVDTAVSTRSYGTHTHTGFGSYHQGTHRTMMTWHHQMETFSTLVVLCEENPLVTGGSPPIPPQWRRALMVSIICALTNDSVNNRGAGDLSCHHAHYDIIVMQCLWSAHIAAPWHSARQWENIYGPEWWKMYELANLILVYISFGENAKITLQWVHM